MKQAKDIKIIIITGNKLRHYWFADYLSKKFDTKGIIIEIKRHPAVSKSRSRLVDWHLRQRDKAEEKYFSRNYDNLFSKNNILKLKTGESNSLKTFGWINKLNPEIIVLYGSSIIQDPLLSHYKNKIINIHLGLSPYYRGTATNFWPLVNKEPECVGATIHLAVAKVDAGSILMQIRPDIFQADNAHDIGCKVIIKGAEAMAMAIEKYVNNQIKLKRQNQKALKAGKLYKRKDFNEEAIKKLRNNFQSGIIEEYLKDKNRRDKKYPII